MKFTLPHQLNVKKPAACDFLLEKASNTIANALENPATQRLTPKGWKIYTKSTSKGLI